MVKVRGARVQIASQDAQKVRYVEGTTHHNARSIDTVMLHCLAMRYPKDKDGEFESRRPSRITV